MPYPGMETNSCNKVYMLKTAQTFRSRDMPQPAAKCKQVVSSLLDFLYNTQFMNEGLDRFETNTPLELHTDQGR